MEQIQLRSTKVDHIQLRSTQLDNIQSNLQKVDQNQLRSKKQYWILKSEKKTV